MKAIDELPPLGAYIRKYRRSERYSLAGLAKRASITKSHLWGIETGHEKNPRLDTMIGIAAATETTLSRIATLAAAGLLEESERLAGEGA